MDATSGDDWFWPDRHSQTALTKQLTHSIAGWIHAKDMFDLTRLDR